MGCIPGAIRLPPGKEGGKEERKKKEGRGGRGIRGEGNGLRTSQSGEKKKRTEGKVKPWRGKEKSMEKCRQKEDEGRR